MGIETFLDQSAVKVLARAAGKRRLLQDIAEFAAPRIELPASEIFLAMHEREQLGTTGVGRGVAIPHARFEALDRVHAVFFRLEQPLDFSSVDQKPVDLVFALLASKCEGAEHLKALALVSRTLRNEETCQKLRSNSDPATLYTILTEKLSQKAA